MSSLTKPDPPHVQQWEHGWTEHEQMQLERLALLPFAEKLAWLEEAHRVVRQLESGRSAKDDPKSG